MIFRLLLYVMQGVSFIGNVLLFLCCDGCDVQSFLFFSHSSYSRWPSSLLKNSTMEG